jgi:transcriptional regulator with XRE-family HTH domain
MRALSHWLWEQRLTQGELAAKLGITESAISQWISGTTSPTVANLRKIRDVTGLSIDKLLADKDRAA